MRGWWSVWSADVQLIVSVVSVLSWWSVVIGHYGQRGQCGGQCDDARLMVSVLMCSWWPANGQLVVSVTMRGWWWSTWWSAGGQLMVSWWSVWQCAAGGG